MAFNNTFLDFSFVNTHTCNTIGVMDISYYNPAQTITEPIMQVLAPGYTNPVELTYYKEGVTILNSSNLNIKKVLDPADYIELPDGPYTIKISICPHDQFYKERTFYRMCKLECLYFKALLELDFAQCSACYSKDKLEKLKLAGLYMEGVLANTNDCNLKEANSLYSKASKILDNLINCDCNDTK
jgi:hypothetical protein